MNIKNKFVAAAISLASVVSSYASVFSIYDGDYSFFDGANQITTGAYEVRWGTYVSGVFTPVAGVSSSDASQGYNDPSSPEISALLSLGNNVDIAAGTQLALNLTFLADDSNYVSAVKEVILTDATWVAPTFALVGPEVAVAFTSSTTALKGSYSFNGGNEVFTIAPAIPEPSTYAALAGVAVLGLAALRRRRA
jgi:hypothetical protein